MSDVKGAVKSTVTIIVITLLAKVFGFIREAAIAAGFGASAVTDSYVVALSICSVLFGSLSRAIQTTFIPVFTEARHQNQEGAFMFANTVINFLTLGLLGFGAVIYFFMPQIIGFISPGFDGDVFQLTVKLARIILPVGVIWGIVGIAGGMLNSLRVFSAPAAVGIAHNLTIVISVFTLGKLWGIEGLAIGTALGVGSQLIVQVPWLKKNGFKWRLVFERGNPAAKKLWLLLVPVLFNMIIVQLNVIVDRLLASGLPEGSISALNFANRLIGFVTGIFIFAVVTVTFPSLSQKAAAGEIGNFKQLFERGVKVILCLTVPATVIILVLRVPIIRLLFQRGAFDSHDTMITAVAFFFYGIGLVGFGLREIINAACYALQDTRLPVAVSVICMMLNIILNIILVRFLAHGGLALAYSTAAAVYVAVTMFFLRRKLAGIGLKGFLTVFAKTGAASMVMGIVLFLGQSLCASAAAGTWVQQALVLGGVIILGGVVYLGSCFLFRVEEIRMMGFLVQSEFCKRFPRS